MQLITKLFPVLTGDEVYEILRARCEVLNIEQTIHYLDLYGVDKRALHCFFWEGKQAATHLCAYLDGDGDKKTVKVDECLSAHGVQGVGRSLMEQSIETIWPVSSRLASIEAKKRRRGQPLITAMPRATPARGIASVCADKMHRARGAVQEH